MLILKMMKIMWLKNNFTNDIIQNSEKVINIEVENIINTQEKEINWSAKPNNTYSNS